VSSWECKSDFEINKAVTMVSGGFKESDYSDFSGNFHRGNQSQDNYKVGVIVDYCNNPSYAWPIILESKISLNWTGGYWCVTSPFSGVHFSIKVDSDADVFKAAMIVYLEMNNA